MLHEAGKFSFAVPEGHPEQGKKVEKGFEYDLCETDAEATTTIEGRKWTLVNLVNDKLKSSARSNSYQNALMPYRPSEVSQDDIKARMIRDYIRLGIPEDVATAQVNSLLANAAG